MSTFKNSVQNYIIRHRGRASTSPPGDIEMQSEGLADETDNVGDSLQANQDRNNPSPSTPSQGRRTSSPGDVTLDMTRETGTDATSLDSVLIPVNGTPTPIPYDELIGSSSPLDNLNMPTEENRLKELIKKAKAPIESVIDFNYAVFMGFFKLDKDGKIVSSLLHTVFASVFLSFALVDVFFNLNRTKYYIKEHKGNKIRRFTESLLIISMGMDRIMYFYGLYKNRTNLSDIYKTFHLSHFVEVFYNPKRWDWFLMLRVSSHIWSIVVCFSGLNVFRMEALRQFGWNFEGLMNIHEENVINSLESLRWWAYQSGTYYDQAMFINSTVTASEIVLGITGMTTGSAGYQVDLSIRDVFLSTVYTLHEVVMAMKMDDVIAGNYSSWTHDALHAYFTNIFRSYERTLRLAQNLNNLISHFLPFMLASDILNLVMVAYYAVDEDWTFFFTHMINPMKTFVAAYFAMTINKEVSKIQQWFTSEGTQKVLNFPPNRFNGVIFEFTNFPIGVGSTATFISETLLVAFLNSSLTYFFLIAQAEDDTTKTMNFTCAAVPNSSLACNVTFTF